MDHTCFLDILIIFLQIHFLLCLTLIMLNYAFFSPLNNDVNFILAFHGLMTAFTVSSAVVGKAFVEIHKPQGSL